MINHLCVTQSYTVGEYNIIQINDKYYCPQLPRKLRSFLPLTLPRRKFILETT